MPAIIHQESLPQEYRWAGEALHELAQPLVLSCGAPAVLSALLSTFLQIAIDTGRTDTAKRLLPFALSNLDALIAIREAELPPEAGAEGQR
jgi:hypothetical protein